MKVGDNVESEGDSSLPGDFVLVRKSEVPRCLQTGEFYNSLNDEDDEQISVPEGTLKLNALIQNNSDLYSLLLSLRFWGVSSVSEEIIEYCLSKNLDQPPEEILDNFREQFRYVDVLLQMLRSGEDSRARLAIESGILELVLALQAECCALPNGCQFAVKAGYAHILQFLHQEGAKLDSQLILDALDSGSLLSVEYLLDQGLEWPADSLVRALLGGSHECFLLAYRSGCSWPNLIKSFPFVTMDEHVDKLRIALQYDWPASHVFITAAAKAGAIQCLQVLQEAHCPWNENACLHASIEGRLECLRYLHENGCPWNVCTVNLAISRGQADCVLYALQNGCPTDESSCYEAANMRQLTILQYLHEAGAPWNERVCNIAAEHGDLAILRYLHENGCPWAIVTCTQAALYGHLKCLQYLHENGCRWKAEVCTAAASKSLECLMYCHGNGCEWDHKTCSAAAGNGKLDCLQYAHEHGCEWTSETCDVSARRGRFACLMYAHEHGCIWGHDTCLLAAQNGKLECLRYAHENGATWGVETCAGATTYNHLACLQYAHEERCRWDELVTRIAATLGHEGCLLYALQNGCPITMRAYNAAVAGDFLNCVNIIKKYAPNLFCKSATVW